MVNFTTSRPFCPDLLWDSGLSWHSDTPHFTECFKNTVICIPYGIFWISAIPWVFSKVLRRPKRPSISALMALKVACILFLLCLFAYDCYQRLQKDLYWSDVLAVSATGLTFHATLALVIFEKYHNTITSLPLSLFWPLAFMAFLPFGWDHYTMNTSPILLAVPITLLVLVMLTCIADSGLHKGHKGPPVSLASYYSALFFTWLDATVIKGFRKPLTQQDLPEAPEYLDVSENTSAFLEAWESQVKANHVDFKAKGHKKVVVKLWRPLIKTFGLRFFAGNLLNLMHTLFDFAGPMVSRIHHNICMIHYLNTFGHCSSI